MNPQASFSIWDWLVVLIYLVIIVGIGFWTARGQGSNRDYFLGGRELSWWLVGLSIIATETSALTFIGVPEMAIGALKFRETGEIYMTGGNLFFMLLIVGHVIGRTIIAIFIVPYYFTGDVYTPYQLLTRAFGKGSRYTAGFLSFVGITTGAGVRIFVTAIPVMILFRVYFPDFSVWMAILLITIAALIYTAVGGVKAVIWTEMIQFFIFVGGGLFALFYIPTLLHGPMATASGAEGWGAVKEVARGSGVLEWWNFGLLSWQGAADARGINADDLTMFPYLMENTKYLLNGPFNLLMGLIPMTVGIIFAFGFDQMLVQRILACRDVKQGRKAMILSAILIFPQFLLFLLIGAALYAFYNLNGMNFGEIMPWDPASVNPETGIGSLNGSFVFPIFIVNHMPVVMKGFMVAAILAAAMSSVAGALSAMSSIFIMDIYRPLVGKARSGKNEIFLSRVATIISGILLAAVALAAMGSTQLISLAFTVAGLTAGGILGAFMFGLWKKKGHDLPVIVSMIVSLIFMTLFWQARVWGYAWNVNWPWHTFIGTIICFGIIWIWHLVDPDTSTRDIRRFDNEDENQPQAEEKKA